jgi:pimeloyl-ACP methyl ester carboxylesterase
LHPLEVGLNTFASFDGATIAYHDEGEGSPVILLHGYGVDALGQFGSFELILPILEERQKLFIETFGGAPPLPDPPEEGRKGIIPPLLAANARVILISVGLVLLRNHVKSPSTQIGPWPAT